MVIRLSTALMVLLLVCGCERSGFDGDACEVNEDCDSGYCSGGYCAGSSCECDDCTAEPQPSDDCEDGWQCSYIPPSLADDIGAAIGSFFGGDGDADGSFRCRATCGNCPPNFHCGRRTTGFCEYGAPVPEVTIQNPEMTGRNEEVLVTADAFIERGSIIRYVWTFPSSDLSTEEVVETVEPRVAHVWTQPGGHYIYLTVHADNGSQIDAQGHVNICSVAGDTCYSNASCCGGLSCDGVCK